MIKYTLTLFFLVFQFIFSQNNMQHVLVGGIAHIGNGEIIENAIIIIDNGKIIEVGSSDTISFNKENALSSLLRFL